MTTHLASTKLKKNTKEHRGDGLHFQKKCWCNTEKEKLIAWAKKEIKEIKEYREFIKTLEKQT